MSAKRQRLAILSYLKKNKRITTSQAREVLNIMSPAPRVLELRAAGHNIVTQMVWRDDEHGRPHKQGQYVLFSGEANA